MISETGHAGACESALRERPPIDRLIGERLAALRLDRNMTLALVAERLGISYQQVQKYERGASALSVTRLFDFTQIYEVDPATILSGLPLDLHLTQTGRHAIDLRGFTESAEGQCLLAAIAPMPPKARRALLELVRSMPKP